ncbi:MAG: glycoside hydrolase family 3 protein [Bacillota bacterium]
MFCIFPALVLAQGNSLAQLIDQKISKMTLEEKVGQLFIVGFPYIKMDRNLETFVTTYKPGSFLLFKRNIRSAEQIKTLNGELYQLAYKTSHLPPLIAIDQEGGAVSRLPINPAPPNALAIGQTQSPLLAEELGYQTGLFLREVGFNMNLAPVLDVADPFGMSFIGVRSFGADPKLVKEIGVAYSKGLLRAQVIPTAKHFPGTGDLKADPHASVVSNSSTISTLKKKDLVPFEGYSSLGTNIAVMLSHSIYPALDESREPASFSPKISTELLRKYLKYQGLVITDDLQMKGSRTLLRPELAALKAIKAGADIVMLTWSFEDQQKAINTVRLAVKNGEITEPELKEKLRRILTAKAFANIYRRDPSLPSLISSGGLSSEAYTNLEDKVLAENIRTNLITKRLPQANKDRNPASIPFVCAFSPSRDFLNGFKSKMIQKVSIRRLQSTSSSLDVTKNAPLNRCPIVLIGVTGKKTAAILKSLPLDIKKRTVVVNLTAPGLVPKEQPYRRVIQLYFNHKDSGKKIAEQFTEILSNDTENFAGLN